MQFDVFITNMKNTRLNIQQALPDMRALCNYHQRKLFMRAG